MHIQCTTACSLEKVNFKVYIAVSEELSKLFQQNSQNILCEYSHKKSECLAQIHTTMTEIWHFSRGLFFYWRTLYILCKVFQMLITLPVKKC